MNAHLKFYLKIKNKKIAYTLALLTWNPSSVSSSDMICKISNSMDIYSNFQNIVHNNVIGVFLLVLFWFIININLLFIINKLHTSIIMKWFMNFATLLLT